MDSNHPPITPHSLTSSQQKYIDTKMHFEKTLNEQKNNEKDNAKENAT